MPFTITCPGCQTPLLLGEDVQGKLVRCPRCQKVVQVNIPKPTVPIVPAPAPPSTPTAALKTAAATPASTPKNPVAGPPARSLPEQLQTGLGFLGEKKLLLPLILGGGLASLLLLTCCVWVVLPGILKTPRSPIVAGPTQPEPPHPKPEEKPTPKPPDRPLTPAEIIEAAKNATVLVDDREGNSYATAFCIHPSGLFVTHANVVRNRIPTRTHRVRMPPNVVPEDSLRLIVNPGTPKQKVLSASLVRGTEIFNLVLLRAEGGGDLPTVALGSEEKVPELTKVAVLGFPLGDALAVQRGLYPEVTVSSGQVTGLVEVGEHQERMQVTAPFNTGSAGGPVLDPTGQVVGVVTGNSGPGVSFAVPVSELIRFLALPEIQLIPPVLDATSVNQPALFQARSVHPVPGLTITGMDLILHDSSGEDRRFKMELVDEVYRAKAVPVPKRDGPGFVRAVVLYQNKPIEGGMEDRVIKVGAHSVRLSEIQFLQRGAPTRVILRDEKVLEGPLTGLDGLQIREGNKVTPLDLVKISWIRFALDSNEVRYSIVAMRDGKEVGRQPGVVAIGPVGAHNARQSLAEQLCLGFPRVESCLIITPRP